MLLEPFNGFLKIPSVETFEWLENVWVIVAVVVDVVELEVTTVNFHC